VRRSWDSYVQLLKWEYLRVRSFLPTMVTIQIMLGLGFVFGLSLLLPTVSHDVALYFATGAPTLSLIFLGLTVVPQELSQAKLTGRYEYMGSFPVPRLAIPAATVTFWLVMQLPGMLVTMLVAAWRFDIHFNVGWTVVPAIMLVALTGATVGYAFAAVLKPQVTGQVTNFLSVGVLLFSPINFPPSRLPSALRAVHRVLPIEYMADVVRGSLTGRYVLGATTAFVVVALWCAAGLGISYRVAVRRG